MVTFQSTAGLPKVRWDVLAGLRFVLAMIVACGHVQMNFTNLDPVTHFASEFGSKAAVLGFFLVSGFSIAASLQRDKRRFYARRFIRIYPLYLFTILVTVMVQEGFQGAALMPSGEVVEPATVPVILGNVLLLQTFLVKPLAFASPIWSLAVEACYYALAPLLLRLPKWVPLAVIVVSAASFVAPHHDHPGMIYYVFSRLNMLKYAWAWFIGYYLYHNRPIGVVIAFAVLGSVLIWQNPYVTPERLSIVTFVGSLVTIYFAAHPALSRGNSRAQSVLLNFLGEVSYPLYLLQYPILIASWGVLGIGNSYALLTMCLLGSIVAYYAVDVLLKRGLFRPIDRRHAMIG